MSQPWTATVVTIFPEMFPGPLGLSLAGKALIGDLWRLNPVDLRGFATDRHRTVDDTPFGGGAGGAREAAGARVGCLDGCKGEGAVCMVRCTYRIYFCNEGTDTRLGKILERS